LSIKFNEAGSENLAEIEPNSGITSVEMIGRSNALRRRRRFAVL
jgi:hypothetical protein